MHLSSPGRSAPLSAQQPEVPCRYCAADGHQLHTDDITKKAKSWLVGDPLNPNSYAGIASRVVFQRAEGLTFFVAQAGLKDDKGILRRIFRKISDFIGWSSKEKRRPVFKTAGVIKVPTNGTHNFTSNKSPYRMSPGIWRMNPPSKRKATHKVQTETGTEYTYSSDAIHEGLERAVHWLMDERVDAIVGDCGFDKGIQMIVNDIIRRYSLAAKEVLVPPPALMSTLQLLPNMLAMLAKDAVLFVLTSNGTSFKKDFNKLTENAPKDKVIVLGLEHVKHFGQEVENGTSINDVEAWPGLEQAIEEKQKLLGNGTRLGGILCECTELPAYSNRIRKRFKVPVFDAMTCASLVASSVKRDDYVNRHERAKQQET